MILSFFVKKGKYPGAFIANNAFWNYMVHMSKGIILSEDCSSYNCA